MSDSLKIPAGVVVSGSGRVKYPRDLVEYGEIYGKTEGAVRSWVRIGKEKGDLPPLDEPSEMVIWWKKWMSHRVPDRMERLAISTRKEDLVLEAPVIPAVEPEKPKKPAPEVPSGDSIDVSGVVVGSAMDSLERLRTASALCWEQYKAYLEAGDAVKADLWRKDWLAAEEKARHWEKDINGIMKNRGELVEKAALIPMLVTLAGTLRRNFIASMKTFARDVAPDLSDAEVEEYARPHVEECFRKLRENEFSLALRA